MTQAARPTETHISSEPLRVDDMPALVRGLSAESLEEVSAALDPWMKRQKPPSGMTEEEWHINIVNRAWWHGLLEKYLTPAGAAWLRHRGVDWSSSMGLPMGRRPVVVDAVQGVVVLSAVPLLDGWLRDGHRPEGWTWAATIAGKPLLWYPVDNEIPAITHRLLADGAVIDTRNRLGETPLMASVARGRFNTMLWLLQHGADPRCATPARGWSAERRARDLVPARLGEGWDPALLLDTLDEVTAAWETGHPETWRPAAPLLAALERERQTEEWDEEVVAQMGWEQVSAMADHGVTPVQTTTENEADEAREPETAARAPRPAGR